LAPFDIKAALRRTGGKPQLLRKLLLGFRDKYTLAGDDLRRLVAAGKRDEAERLAHSLKSVAAMLEAGSLAAAAAELEQALHNREDVDLELLIGKAENELHPAIDAVNSLEVRSLSP
jgi:HPt (histidine-containing phosphotransfer) domain-containing protein